MLNKEQKDFVGRVLQSSQNIIFGFYAEKDHDSSHVLEIYKSILDPSYIIKGRGKPLDFSIYNQIKKIIQNKDNLLPLATAMNYSVHEYAYSMWATVNAEEGKIQGFNFIKKADHKVVEDFKSEHPDNYKDVYTAYIKEEVKKISREWLENRVKELEQGKAIQPESKNNNENVSSSILSSTSSTQSNTPESRPKTPDPNTFVGKLAIQDEKAKSSSNQRE